MAAQAPAVPRGPSCHISTVPFIVTFNRSHLPVLPERHAAALEVELCDCTSPAQQVRLLLREPLLLFTVVQREVTRSTTEDSCAWSWCAEDLRPVLEAAGSPDLAASSISRRRSRNSLTSEPLRTRHDVSPPLSSSWIAEGGDAPKDTPTPKSRWEVVRSAVEAFERQLSNLVPITSRASGVIRADLFYHRYRQDVPLTAEEAVWARYEKVKALGRGHFGEVIRGKELASGQDVAVKAFERMESENPDEPDCDEGHLLLALAHPNLVRIYEVIETVEEVYVVMELASGGTLSRFATKTARGPWIAAAMQQIASATAYCHHCNVLHGDLKPENVLVGGLRPDGSPMCLVSDFGHASICVGVRRQVAAAGDTRYIAPEVVDGERMSPKSDVYMLGMMAYELLTGGWLPFFQEKAEALDAPLPFYDSTMAWHMVYKDSTVRKRAREGLSWKDKERLEKPTRLKIEAGDWCAPPEAAELVASMLSWQEVNRPTAVEIQGSAWLRGCRQMGRDYCEAWGLWAPERPSFAEGLRKRAGRSWRYRLILALAGGRLCSERILGARLLFQSMDSSGAGFLMREDFLRTAAEVDLDPGIAEALFTACDFYHQGFVDFKNLCSTLLDVEEFPESELLSVLQAALNRMRGPVLVDGANDVQSPKISFKDLEAHFEQPHSVHPPVESQAYHALEQIQVDFNLAEEISAEVLLKMLRDDRI